MDIVLRALFLFFLIYVVLKVIGRRELSRLEPFDFVLLIVLGDAVQQGLTQDDYSVTGATIVVATIALALTRGLTVRACCFDAQPPASEGAAPSGESSGGTARCSIASR